MDQYSHLRFTLQEVEKIKMRFDEYAQKGRMKSESFKKSMGLLGIGEAEALSERIFGLITGADDECCFEDFIEFLDRINHGSIEEKAKVSFKFLDRHSKDYINYDDIEVIISEISFIWNFLTGEKISNSDCIEVICLRLGVTESKAIGFGEFLDRYNSQFSWFDYFNSKSNETISHKADPRKTTFPIDQIEEYLKLLHHSLEEMIFEFGQETQDINPNHLETHQIFTHLTKTLGPHRISSQQIKPTGDPDFYRGTLPYLKHSELSKELKTIGHSTPEIIANNLSQLATFSEKLFTNESVAKSEQVKINARLSFRNTFILEEEKKKRLLNITQPSSKRKNIVYFGHQNWNLMLNMMLGIRKSLKSHYYVYQEMIKFSEEDLNCKYSHELIYKRNEKSVKEISEIFVDYAPKVFFYLRKYFCIDNQQFLKSIGLENLIGNLLMGNLSSLTDQTSEGKSGSFIYYTEDSKLIVKSISKDEYTKLRQILNHYVQFVREHPKTFLMRIYGLYKLKNKGNNRQIYFIVIHNVFDTQGEISQRYDIKGATYGRQAIDPQENIVEFLKKNKNVALKDVDLMTHRKNRFTNIPSLQKDMYVCDYLLRILQQITKDAQFLAAHNIIEYSLLIGIHKINFDDLSVPESLFSKKVNQTAKVVDNSQREEYFLGIIDMLSEYSAKKVLENHFFHLFNNDISCLAPEEYYLRFKKFITEYVF